MLASEWPEIELAVDVQSALAALAERDFDVILSDVRMPDRSGMELVREAARLRRHTPIVLMTGYGSVESAVEAMRAGAFDYLTKPVKRRQLLDALERAYERRLRAAGTPGTEPRFASAVSYGRLIGSSEPMRAIYALIHKVADNLSNVLITGESGTGKELVARTIHETGPRATRPYVAVNCTAIPEGLLESELFGHARGAFTGAVEDKTGLFEQARGGTLFLDEIGDMGLALQGKLLRVLQEREVRPVGGSRAIPVDVRIVAATHRDLRVEMEAGTFRADLFYRLNVIPIHIPALRDRPADVRELALHFLRARAPEAPPRIASEVLDHLTRLPWEGNVRELENAIERALALGDGTEIHLEDLPDAEGSAPIGRDDAVRTLVERRLSLREIQDRVIDEALRVTGGNKQRAARILGISRRTLYRRDEKDRDDKSDALPPVTPPGA